MPQKRRPRRWQANHPIGFRLFSKVCSAGPERRVARIRARARRAVLSVTPRAGAPQAGSYALDLYTLAESDGALATMAEVYSPSRQTAPVRGYQAA